MKRHLILMSAAVLAAGGVALPAQAQTVGSASLATVRNCNLVGAGENCDGTGPGQLIASRQYGGGVGVGGLNEFMPSAGNRAWSFVTFDSTLDLPQIRGFSTAAGNVRMNINAIAFQTYTWTGAAPTDFSITGALHIVDSSASPSGGARPGGAIYSHYVGVWDPAAITGLSTPEQLFSALFYAPCGVANVLGAGGASGDLTGGSATYTATTSACAPGSLTLAPGQSVLVVAGMQLPVNRGAFADSSATFVTRLGDDLAPETQTQLVASLNSAVDQGAALNVVGRPGAVPEPASWAMLIAGFGLVGALARRRRASLVQSS
jgi:hypothetical protein